VPQQNMKQQQHKGCQNKLIAYASSHTRSLTSQSPYINCNLWRKQEDKGRLCPPQWCTIEAYEECDTSDLEPILYLINHMF
jgi:hypothetical protein